jgi:Phage major capsid protein E
MPNVGHVAWEQRPCLTPISAIIVQNLAGAFDSRTAEIAGCVMTVHSRTFRSSGKQKRALGVQAILEWAFRVEKAQLELPPPTETTEESNGYGLEYVLIQRARLGCQVGILFEEYNGSVTLSTGVTERLIPAGEGIAFPMGTFDTFTTYGGPANLLEAANTIGLPLYARQHLDEKGRWIDLMTEASILPVNKRPRIAIRLHSSN